MAFLLADRVRETSTAPGTGAFTVNGAVQGAQSFASALTSNGDTTWYTATNGTAWETGLLTRTSATVYARTTIFASSNGGSAVNFASGVVDVFIDVPASQTGVRSKLIAITRDLTLATGSVAYTGVGFRPSAMIATAGIGASTDYLIALGIADSSLSAGNLLLYSSGTGFPTAIFLNFFAASGAQQVAAIASYDSDGFTLSWVKTGLPTGTVTIYILCLR